MSVLGTRLLTLHFVGMPVYILVNSYIDSNKCLSDYRLGRNLGYNANRIRDEREAVVFGVMDNLPKNLCFAGLWPLAVPLLIIPRVVLKMNSVDEN